MSLAIVGGTVVDLIFPGLARLPAWPKAHTEFTAANLVCAPRAPLVTLGGNGANAAYVAAGGGAKVTLHTSLADDALGGLARGWLEAAGCVVRSGGRRAGATAINVTAADARHRRATLFYAGAAFAMPRFAAPVRGLRAVLVCGWPHPPLPAIAREFAALRRRGVLTALDPGPLLDRPWTLAALKSVLAQLDLLLVNEHELCAIARTADLRAALQRWRAHHAGDIVVKRGRRGALWLPAGVRAPAEAREFPSRRVTVVNTVGAGDTFNGALLAALDRGASFPAALRTANRMATRVVTSSRGVLGVRP